VARRPLARQHWLARGAYGWAEPQHAPNPIGHPQRGIVVAATSPPCTVRRRPRGQPGGEDADIPSFTRLSAATVMPCADLMLTIRNLGAPANRAVMAVPGHGGADQRAVGPELSSSTDRHMAHPGIA
jgi:hypothetical protein